MMASRTVLMGSSSDDSETTPASHAWASKGGSLRVIRTTRSGLDQGEGQPCEGGFIKDQNAVLRRIRAIDRLDVPGATAGQRFPDRGRKCGVGYGKLNRLHHGRLPTSAFPGYFFS